MFLTGGAGAPTGGNAGGPCHRFYAYGRRRGRSFARHGLFESHLAGGAKKSKPVTGGDTGGTVRRPLPVPPFVPGQLDAGPALYVFDETQNLFALIQNLDH